MREVTIPSTRKMKVFLMRESKSSCLWCYHDYIICYSGMWWCGKMLVDPVLMGCGHLEQQQLDLPYVHS